MPRPRYTTWRPGGAAPGPAPPCAVDKQTVFVAADADWDRAQQVTLEHALALSAVQLARTNGPEPGGHGVVDALHTVIEPAVDSDAEHAWTAAEPARLVVESITVVLSGKKDLEPFEVTLPTDVALFRTRAGGHHDPAAPVITTRVKHTGVDAIARMMADAYWYHDEGEKRQRFMRRCIRRLRRHPGLGREPADWLIRDTLRRRIAPLLDDRRTRTRIEIERDGRITVDHEYGTDR